jgi:hypothetical protein
MKRQLIKLNRIGKVIDLSRFYAITVYEHSITLQGNFTNVTCKTLAKYFDFKLDTENGFVCGSRNGINITLT